MKRIGLVTFSRDRYGRVVNPEIPYCTYDVDEAKKIFKRRKAENRMKSSR